MKELFSEEQRRRIVDSIRVAELSTSAEIRVHIENNCKIDVLDRAVEVFSMLKMHKTQQRNGVLVYLAVKDHKSAIIGDVNINKVVGDDFWNRCYIAMAVHFSKGNFTDGICCAVEMLQGELNVQFPYKSDDVNELSDEISFGE